MKTFFLIPLLICIIFFSVNSASAQSNYDSSQTNKKLSLNSWDKTVSWFKKTVLPTKSVTVPLISTPPSKPVVTSIQQPKTIPIKKKNKSKLIKNQQIVVNNKNVEKLDKAPAISEVIVKKISEEKQMSYDTVINNYVAPPNPIAVDVGSLNLERPMTVAKGINSSGVVVGYSVKNNRSPSNPFISKNGNIKNIGGGYYGVANAINDNDQAVGQIVESNNAGRFSGMVRPFIWENSKITKIGMSPGVALDINNKKQVVGFMWMGQYEGYPLHSFIWENGVTKDLGTLGGDDNGGATTANAINDLGQVVGCSIAKDGFQHPFLWENGKMKDLGNFYNEGGCAVDINNFGQVVGYFYKKDDNPKYRIIEAFLWKQNELTTLTDAPKNFWPYKINNHGDIVGAFNGMTIRRNGVYSSYLELSGWSLDVSDGVGFNDNGQVAGSANRAENNNKYGLIISLPDILPETIIKNKKEVKEEQVIEIRDPNVAYPVQVNI